MSLADFKKDIKKVSHKRNVVITNSYGVYDAYKFNYRNNWKYCRRKYSKQEYYSVIRLVGKYISKSLSEGDFIKLPCRMGKLDIRKKTPVIKKIDGKLVICRSVDWNRTLEYWYESETARNNKELIYVENKDVYTLVYDKSTANYNNKVFYMFKFNRFLKQNLKENIKDNKIDALNIY